MTKSVACALEPARDISLTSFDIAIKIIGEVEFYILACHSNCKDIAQIIKSEHKSRGIEVDIILRNHGNEFAWFVHGMNNQGPPFLIGTVHSHVFA